ncbi:MAG TPA: aminotransferase class III-fold pyridoxal phosphate-dependent enzyme [Myxococcota bacterium]|nr:aminotransferase class III-fold pyridoxal phosphate-dependent enzyme [Myxococcota bacterium]
MTALLPVYPRLPFELVRAEGDRLFCANGRVLLDLYGGHAVTPLGHGHPELTAALTEAHRTLDFFSNSVVMDVQERAARAVLGGSEHLAHVHFVNSGTEANESALHVARRMTGRTRIVALSDGFHGRTLGSLGVTGLGGYRKRLGVPAVAEHARFVDLNDPGALDAIDDTVAGVLIESVPSLGGVHLPDPAWLQAIERRCREVGALLLFDEVQGGVGRLGRWFAHERFGVRPDVVTLAKSLGGGFPVGAMVVTPAIGAWARDGELGTTFGGGPMACAMVETVARVIHRDGLMARAEAVFERVRDGLADVDDVEVRGAGCLIGVQTPRPAAWVRDALLVHDVLVGTSSHPHTLRLLPPYTVSWEAVDRFVQALREVMDA